MKHIDTSFLYKPTPEKPGEPFNNEGWGYLNIEDLNIVDHFQQIQLACGQLDEVIEIGMFAGHSTVMMLEMWQPHKLTSYDPNHVSAASAAEIKKRYSNFDFYNSAIWGQEDRHDDVDLIFIDGDHSTQSVVRDIHSALTIGTRNILFDNVEHNGVSTALNRLGLYNTEFNPQYFFYVNRHKESVKPGIMMLIDLEGVDDATIIRVLANAAQRV